MRFSASTCASALLQTHLLLAAFLLPQSAQAADDSKKTKTPKPCTARSPSTDRFFDLNPIWLQPPSEDNKKKSKEDQRTESWKARGYDIGYNFTLNFCGPVIEQLEDVVGVKEALWRNVSAFYERDGKTFSLGNQNAEPVFRGRKLVLNYTEGSPCGSSSSRGRRAEGLLEDARELKGDKGKGHDDDDDDDDRGKNKDNKRRKSTIISLLCESDALADTAAISFVAADADECTYFFEARSSAACGGIEKAAQTLGPGGIFGMIFFIAIAAYLIGGCVYQRNVMHQRGWRQLPNYALWAGIWSFLRDLFVILTSSCARFLPSRRGYSRLNIGHNSRSRGSGGGGNHHSEDADRLIDQLDEEWDD